MVVGVLWKVTVLEAVIEAAVVVVVKGRVVKTFVLPGVGVEVYAYEELLLLYAHVTL